jgi:hypothetical protein
MIISLGSDCVAKKRLEEFYYNEKTQSNLFDWVLSDLTTVCQVLEDHILKKSIFIPKNFEILTKTIDEKYAVSHKHMNFVSLHDAPITLSEDEAIQTVCNKYTRRLNRFITDVINCESPICFLGVYDNSNPIQTGKMYVDDTTILRFFRMLHTINPLNSHKLILVVDSKTKLLTRSKRVKVINSDEFVNMKSYEKDWYRFYFDWEKIFDLIEEYMPKDALECTRDLHVQ